jgi:hypothetical protein
MPDVYWPSCDNYEEIFVGEMRRPRRTPDSKPERPKRKQQIDFCNQVLWSILEHLEAIAHPLVDANHRRVYSFWCDDHVLEADDKFTCWASLNDPRMFTPEFVRHLESEIFSDDRFRAYNVRFNTEFDDAIAIIGSYGLTLDDRKVPVRDLDWEVRHWQRNLLINKERSYRGIDRVILAHLKSVLPGKRRIFSCEVPTAVAAIFDDIDPSPSMRLYFLADVDFHREWDSVVQELGSDCGSYVDESGRIGIRGMDYPGCESRLHERIYDLPADQDLRMEFVCRDTDRRHHLSIPASEIVTLSELFRRYPSPYADMTSSRP